jgi:DNA-binding NarL/FixJ family response regulator
MDRYRIVLADDHAILRQGLRRILAANPDLEVVGEASDGFELMSLLKKCVPHLIILDISMPNLRGLEVIHEIKKMSRAQILILTMHKDKEYLYLALSSGAKGYMLKEDADKELFSAIEKIRQGKTYLSPHASALLADDWSVGGEKSISLSDSSRLTPREREVLKLIAEGKSSRETAELLSISARTVERHRDNMMRKLSLKKATELVRYAIKKGYI